MPLTSQIVAYDPAWQARFEAEAQRLQTVFDSAALAIHHVGSTSVPGLWAKPEIDILVVIADITSITRFEGPMANLGYGAPVEMLPDHFYFRRNHQEKRTHKVHVCGPDHFSISEFLVFRDHLRSCAKARADYEALKLKLESENTQGILEYLEGKAPFIRAALDRQQASS